MVILNNLVYIAIRTYLAIYYHICNYTATVACTGAKKFAITNSIYD